MAIPTVETAAAVPVFDQKKVELLRNTICKGSSPEEFELFVMACTRTGLDPFMRQIHAVKRWDARLQRESMTIQTGIDGYRLIAERTGCYAPGPEPTYSHGDEGKLISSTAYVKKQTKDGTWHTVAATAFFDEYCQKDKSGKPTGMWRTMERNQLAKCAEALALRRAFPAEMSGIYTKEEMEQAEPAKITLEQAADLEMILEECDPKFKEWFMNHAKKTYHMESIADAPVEIFTRMRDAAMKHRDEYFKKQQEQFKQQEETVVAAAEVQ